MPWNGRGFFSVIISPACFKTFPAHACPEFARNNLPSGFAGCQADRYSRISSRSDIAKFSAGVSDCRITICKKLCKLSGIACSALVLTAAFLAFGVLFPDFLLNRALVIRTPDHFWHIWPRNYVPFSGFVALVRDSVGLARVNPTVDEFQNGRTVSRLK